MAHHQQYIIEEAERLMIERAKTPEEAIPYATMNYVEGAGECDGLDLGRVTVGYGDDREMCETGPHPDEWWEFSPPVDGYRFRVFIPKEPDGSDAQITEVIDDVMAAVGAFPVGVFDDKCDSYDHRGRYAMHYQLPDGSPVHGVLGELEAKL